MRHALLLTVFLLLTPAASHAQVTIDLRALESLPPGPQAPPPTSHSTPAHPAARSRPAHQAGTVASPPTRPTVAALPTPPVAPAAPPAQSAVALPPTPAPPAATLPTAPPAVATLAPIPPPELPAKPVPPPAPPVSATSATAAVPESTGLQLTFRADEADLSPAADAAIAALVKATPQADTISYNVVAYASGATDDPSVARRQSLSRGLAVRGALVADGVPSTRVYVRALGAAGGAGPPDRVDVTVLGLSGAPVATKP